MSDYWYTWLLLPFLSWVTLLWLAGRMDGWADLTNHYTCGERQPTQTLRYSTVTVQRARGIPSNFRNITTFGD